MKENEPIEKINNTTVKTPDQYYKVTCVELYPNYLHLFTSPEQNHTEHELWIPADSSIEIGTENSLRY